MADTNSSNPKVPLPVAVDTMGGDYGPDVIIDGAVQAAEELGVPSILVGDQSLISSRLKKSRGKNQDLIQVKHASQVITMKDVPSRAIRSKTDASMRIAYQLVKEGSACGVVSTGNTGAMMALGVLMSGTLPGIARPAIASLIPKVGDLPPTVLLDSGANIDCHAQQLVQFALMGDFYARAAISCDNPRVALLSNGAEDSKGNDIIRSAALTLSELEDVNFVGFVEGQDISRDVVDVVVCDGFVGNIVLKAMEGSVELVFDSMRHYIEKKSRGRLGFWLTKPLFKSLFQDVLDPSSYGGAPLLGLNEIGIVCHGSANKRAIMYGIKVAGQLYDKGLIQQMTQALSVLDLSISEAFQEGLWNRMGQQFGKRSKKDRNKKDDKK